MNLETTSSDELRRQADALQREMAEQYVRMLDIKKRRIMVAVRLDEVHSELRKRELYAA